MNNGIYSFLFKFRGDGYNCCSQINKGAQLASSAQTESIAVRSYWSHWFSSFLNEFPINDCSQITIEERER